MDANNRITTKPGIIRHERSKSGLSQLTLATRAGLCLNTISLLERSGQCTAEVARRVATALGLKFSDLVADSSAAGGAR